jgi:iron complex outermembrane recepter protein
MQCAFLCNTRRLQGIYRSHTQCASQAWDRKRRKIVFAVKGIFMIRLSRTVLVSLVALVHSGPLFAQSAAAAVDQSGAAASDTEIGEVIVTATKTGEQNLEKVPIAVSAFSSTDIKERGATELVDLAPFTPSFTFGFNGPWLISSIRGIGTNNVLAGGDPSTTLQVDGVYYGRPTGANLDFLDVERVEVLRGPQGTLYGRNAIGGTVNVITEDPTDVFHSQLQISGGDYGLIREEAVVSGPLIGDTLSASLSARNSTHDGYIKELNPALPYQWDENHKAVRGKLKYAPVPGLSVILSADYSKANDLYNSYTVRLSPLSIPDGTNPGFFQAALDDPNQDRVMQWGASARVIWDMGASTLTSISAYRQNSSWFDGDVDYSEQPLFDQRQFVENQDQISQELDLAGHVGRADYVVGLFGFRERINSYFYAAIFNSLLEAQGIRTETDSGAAFGQLDIPLTDQLKFTAGLRYTSDHKKAENIYGAQSFNPPGAAGGLTDDPNQRPANVAQIFSGSNTRPATTPKIGLEYQATPDLLAYGSVTDGYKSGGYNFLINPGTVGAAEYGPEHVRAYEAGLKERLPSINGHINLATFYYRYTGLQVNQFVFVQNNVGQLVNNAPAAIIKGAEVEWATQPVSAVEAGGSAAFLDARYSGYFPAINNFTGGIVNPDGKTLNDAPRWSGSVYLQLSQRLSDKVEAHLRGDTSYKSAVYYTPLNDSRIGSGGYWLSNANLFLTAKDSGLEGGVRVKNIMNREYITTAYYSFSAAGEPGEPRTVVFYLNYRF